MRLAGPRLAIVAVTVVISASTALAEPPREAHWCESMGTDVRCGALPTHRRGQQWWCFEEEQGDPHATLFCAATVAVCRARVRLVSPFRTGPSACTQRSADAIAGTH